MLKESSSAAPVVVVTHPRGCCRMRDDGRMRGVTAVSGKLRQTKAPHYIFKRRQQYDYRSNTAWCHRLAGSPAHRLTVSPAHRLAGSPAHRLAGSPAHRLTGSPARRLGLGRKLRAWTWACMGVGSCPPVLAYVLNVPKYVPRANFISPGAVLRGPEFTCATLRRNARFSLPGHFCNQEVRAKTSGHKNYTPTLF
jgi:hypothetical protein